jgi:hypothetical protein
VLLTWPADLLGLGLFLGGLAFLLFFGLFWRLAFAVWRNETELAGFIELELPGRLIVIRYELRWPECYLRLFCLGRPCGQMCTSDLLLGLKKRWPISKIPAGEDRSLDQIVKFLLKLSDGWFLLPKIASRLHLKGGGMLRYGLADPSLTGEILGYWYALRGFGLPVFVTVVPDFENEGIWFEGTGQVAFSPLDLAGTIIFNLLRPPGRRFLRSWLVAARQADGADNKSF